MFAVTMKAAGLARTPFVRPLMALASTRGSIGSLDEMCERTLEVVSSLLARQIAPGEEPMAGTAHCSTKRATSALGRAPTGST